MSAIIKYTAEAGGEISLSIDTVRKLIACNEQVTDQEFMAFAALCKTYRLNPFIREAYLIKYGNKPATMVTGKDVFTKRAFRHPRFKGMEAGLSIRTSDGRVIRRDGSMALLDEEILGGWCRVYLDGYEKPMFDEVSFMEYAGRKSDGTLNKTWASKPGTMIRKVAIVHALREAFPEEFGGLYDQAEMGVEAQPEAPIEVPAVVEDCVAYEEEPYRPDRVDAFIAECVVNKTLVSEAIRESMEPMRGGEF